MVSLQIPLATGWTVRPDSPSPLPDGTVVEARVPGCVHTDLLAAGLVPDPFLDDNERKLAWAGRTDWLYRTELPALDDAYERTDLVFDGLDTVAEIRLGDRLLGRTRNMHRSYRFDVTGASGPLSVRFTSAYTEAESVRKEVGDRPTTYTEPFNFVRKMASSFGWDWGPTLVTAGLWRPVRLERWNVARLARVRPLVTVHDGDGRVELRLDLERAAGDVPLEVRVRVGDAVAAATVEGDQAVVVVPVPRPRLWWPRGYGEQPLYDCVVTLSAGGHELDRWERRIGFRTIELDTAADAHGSAFTLVVNGEPIFARGVNWIPDDVFPSRVTPERYRRRLAQAAAANVDLVRVWGGGIYEDEAFYDACDELGLLVWQDFLFACGAYSEEEPLRGEIDAEARENVARLMPHPSLAVWNGNNENLWGFRDWGWEEKLAGASWGEGYYLGLLPRIVADTDPTRPYWPGSPWSGSWRRHPNDPAHGTTHSWTVWNERDYADYLLDVPRFVAEFGWQAPPAWATLERALSDRRHLEHHQKAADGAGKLARGLARHFGPPDSFADWHHLTQVVQARAIAAGIEHWRAHWPVCAGTIVWQLNDCWPVISWSAIDGDARLKPLYFELRRVYADRLLTLAENRVSVVNQAATPWSGTLRVLRADAGGRVLAEAELPFNAAPRTVATLDLPAGLATAGDVTREFWTAAADGLRAWRFACPDRDFAYPEPRMDVEVTPADGGCAVTVTARTLIRDLYLHADRLHPEATADQGLTTLLPGERHTINVRGWAGDPAELDAALRHVHPRRSA
ncbi:glycoside hydrolase family 2 protein [Nonomuraea sp. NN258]|uniref:glycoside hydrolase family 2 protein n=1 Tax=Nonomuraea antri TaxID=2730852 RepID=UPI00156A0D9A|nr:glycoside hydrolase family 2 protein [Nonomuraea antri]NRQ36709.1 glycoside hydrolase family 2 protein [Nonomuraea antri]